MKTATFAFLGIALLLGTDAIAASASPETENLPISTTAAATLTTDAGAAGRGGWIKRKKRRVVPAYRRNMRRHR